MMEEFCFVMSVTGLSRSNIGKDKDDDEEACCINFHSRVGFFIFYWDHNVFVNADILFNCVNDIL